MNNKTGGALTAWEKVRIGDIVAGRGGHPWAVVGRKPGADGEAMTVELEHEDGRKWKGQVRGEVLVLHSIAEEEALAVATMQLRLGGVVVSETDDQGRQVVPVTFPDPGSLLAHIYLIHGREVTIQVGDQAMKELIATHEELHRPENRTKESGWIDHVHEPDFYARRNRGEEPS